MLMSSGTGEQVPVDVPHLHVTEIGSQHRDLGVDVGALVVPGLDTPHHHAVPQVVHARRAGPAGRGPAQLAAEHDEGAVSGVVADPVAAVGAEERLAAGGRAEAALPPGGVGTQRRQGGRVQRDQPGPAAVAGLDGEHAAGQVDILAGQRKRLGDPQPGAGEQSEQRGIAVRPQPAGQRQPSRGGQQIGDLTVGIDVRRFAVPGRAEQPWRLVLRWHRPARTGDAGSRAPSPAGERGCTDPVRPSTPPS